MVKKKVPAKHERLTIRYNPKSAEGEIVEWFKNRFKDNQDNMSGFLREFIYHSCAYQAADTSIENEEIKKRLVDAVGFFAGELAKVESRLKYLTASSPASPVGEKASVHSSTKSKKSGSITKNTSFSESLKL